MTFKAGVSEERQCLNLQGQAVHEKLLSNVGNYNNKIY
jgi:hypothetical protein